MKHTVQTVRSEASRIQESAGVLDAVVGDVRDRLVKYFGYGRKMPEKALRDMVKDIHTTISAEFRPIRERIDVRHPTRVRPKSEAYELFYLVVMPEDQLGEGRPRYFRLSSLRVLATRKRIVIDCMPTALGIREHAALRYIDRGADRMEAIRHLATSLAGWAALPGLVDGALEEAGFERMGVTGCRGLLLGALDPRAPIPPGRRFTFGNGMWSEEDVPVSPLVSDTFTINTYIGDGEIQPNQRGAMAVIDQWRKSCGKSFELACEDVFWPERELAQASGAEIDDDLVDAIRGLMVEKRMLKAMGNAKIAGLHRLDLHEHDDANAASVGPAQVGADEEREAGMGFR